MGVICIQGWRTTGLGRWCVCVCACAWEVSHTPVRPHTTADVSVQDRCVVHSRRGEELSAVLQQRRRFSSPLTFSPNRQSLRTERLPGGCQWKYKSCTSRTLLLLTTLTLYESMCREGNIHERQLEQPTDPSSVNTGPAR